MRCPACKSNKSRVVKTLPLKTTNMRVRLCMGCYESFKTKEDYISDPEKVMALVQEAQNLNNTFRKNKLEKTV